MKLTDPRDIQLARQAQGAIMRRTILPSGLTTPDVELVVVGTRLIVRQSKRAQDLRRNLGVEP
jgi:hypothetical protein